MHDINFTSATGTSTASARQRVVGVIGHAMAEQLDERGAEIVLAAAAENEQGVRRCAQQAGSRKLARPAGLLVKMINDGDHLTRAPLQKEMLQGEQLAMRLYQSKLDDVNRYRPEWPLRRRQELALDYALDHCRVSGALVLEVETWLRDRLRLPNHPNPHPGGGPEVITKW